MAQENDTGTKWRDLLKWLLVAIVATPVVVVLIIAAACVGIVWLTYRSLVDPWMTRITSAKSSKERKQRKRSEKERRDDELSELTRIYGKQDAELLMKNRRANG